MLHGCRLMAEAEFYVAVDNAGLWPQLIVTPERELLAAAYDYPGHGVGNGNIGVWASRDGGRTWAHRGTASAHDGKDSARLNHAIGLNAEGDVVVLSGLWTENLRVPGPVQVCLSHDAGRTWTRRELENTRDAGAVHPFGGIFICRDGSLACAIHNDSEKRSYMYRSRDGGMSWNERSLIAEEGTETALLDGGNGRWLAAVRRRPSDPEQCARQAGETMLLESEDDAVTWKLSGALTGPRQAPGHFLRLRHGRILFATTTRVEGAFGVLTRWSSDDGRTWSDTEPLVTMPATADCGYPSSVQLSDDTVVTAYYFGPKHKSYAIETTPGGLPWHCRYHMGVARWRPESLGAP